MAFEYSESTYNPRIIKNQNGVRVLDPNPSQEIAPLEDMFIYISLVAKQRSRSVLTQVDDNFYNFETRKASTIDIAVPQEETFSGSKLFRSKPMLTTDWTEIGGYRNSIDLFKDYEGFSITNVDVKIQSQTAPQIVIDFVDVRGATLFEQGSCSPYGLFFKLPYPIFVLTLKGYYGRPVEYYLNLVKFNSKFNSDTGNMDCRAEFIGYSFAFLSDMIMGYVGASQYLKKETYRPQEILRKKYIDTVARDKNTFENFCDNPVITEGKCYTINDLLRVVNDFDTYTQPQIVNSPEFNELQNLTALKSSYDTYVQQVNDLIRELEAELKSGVNTKADFGDGSSRPIRFEIKTDEIFEKLIKDGGILNKYFSNKSGILSASIRTTKGKEIKPGVKADTVIEMLTSATPEQFSSTDPNNQCPGCDLLYDKLAAEPWNNIFNPSYGPDGVKSANFGVIFKTSVTLTADTKFIDLGYIVKDIEAERSKLSGSDGGDTKTDGVITEKRKKLIEDINKLVKQQLGFDPTIRNIFTILLCNTDAFMEILVNVATEAEKYHAQRNSEYEKLTAKSGEGNVGLISGEAKVYSWPTYYIKEYPGVGNSTNTAKTQGTKENYPGNNTRFLNWVEVRFVEDFIDAFLEYNRDRKINAGDLEGLAGYDNYVPVSPLESPALSRRTPIKYLDLNNKDEIYPVIGERLFIALDHSLFSPIRLTEDASYIPTIGKGKWNPIKNNEPNNLSVDLGVLEANNILNCQDNEAGITVLATIINENSKQEFYDSVIKLLTDSANNAGGSFKTLKAKELVREGVKTLISSNDLTPDGLGFDLEDDYYVYDPGKEGILLSHKTLNKGFRTYIKPNPFDMDSQAGELPTFGTLITIVNPTDVKDDFKIKFIPEDGPMKLAADNFNQKLVQKTSEITFATKDFDPKVKTELDAGQKIPTWADPTLFTTLAMVSDSNEDGEPWFTNKTISSLAVSNMGLITHINQFSTQDSEIYGISLFAPDGESKNAPLFNSNFKDKLTLDGVEVELKDDVYDEGAATSFITTPLWLDNVIAFRKSGSNQTPLNTPTNFYIGENQRNYDEKEIQDRNLAYLFLQTLKTTPLITRKADDDGNLYYGDDASNVYSLLSFNTAAGVVKVPKAWVLNLGAILWRWKMFAGTKTIDGKRVWNKTQTCNGCNQGDTPNGFDPLAQPGWNSYDNGTLNLYGRNRPNEYLTKIYGGYSATFQKSSFATPTSDKYGTTNDNIGNKLGGAAVNGLGGTPDVYAYFPYFNYYKNKLGYEFDSWLNTYDFDTAKTFYSWPMLWIAPHHIPYVHPPRFYDKEAFGTLFIQLFTNDIGYMDYTSIMNVTTNNDDYYETGGFGFGSSLNKNEENNTERTKKYDGNLGMVLQYLPDSVKDELVKYFDQWCGNEWQNLLGVVDPVNFGGTSSTLASIYKWDTKTPKEFKSAYDEGVSLVPNPDSAASLRKLLDDQVLIYNSTPKIWYGITSAKEGNTKDGSSDFYPAFLVSKINFENYLGALFDEFRKNKDKKQEEINKKTTEEENALSGSLIDDSDIKLALYRTFKSLTDKWISATPAGRSFFNVTDNGKGCGVDATGPRTLASHFQYVNRVMGDIGNIAMINISKIRELNDNIKISLYQYLGDILTDNEYMFFPLPGYVDFTSQGISDEDLKDMFKPVLSLKRLSCGPVFLCMYVGGNSRQLKYKAFANCPEDLKELKQLEDDSFTTTGLDAPLEMTSPQETDPNGGGGYTSFKIVYGLENQNHFKNIQLDQSEFSETAESLLVIDKLSQQGGTDQTSKGQNLNSVYLTRSYSCQVETLGNMMIQPMTYFDLLGVPMFYGAYLITTVEHNFKPNHATTRFKGVRQPRTTIPVVTDAAIAMNMSFKDMKSDGSGASISSLVNNNTTSTGSETVTFSTNSFDQVITQEQPLRTPPTLNEILDVMKKKKGVFYSDKSPKQGSMKALRDNLIQNKQYEPNKNYIIYEDPFVVNIVGIRNFIQTPGYFDDYLAVFYKDNSKNWQFKVWQITTDPGVMGNALFVTDDAKALGAGFIAEGQYVGSHITGHHFSNPPGYSALSNQRPILIYRDNDNDIWAEKRIDSLTISTPGMNIHNSGPRKDINQVYNWSAGCQVFKDPKDYSEFLDIVLSKAQNPKVGSSTTKVVLKDKYGQDLTKFLPANSTLKDGESTPVRSFTYTLLNTAEFGKPSGINIGDPVYENYIPGGARAGSVTTGTVSGGKCTPSQALANPNDYKPVSFKDTNVGTKGGIKWNDINSKAQKYLWADYAPLFENDASVKSLSKGLKILMIGQAIQEGYFPGARAYTTKNPGNIGNTDNYGASGGQNTSLGSLKNGTLAQAKYIYSSIGKSTTAQGVPADVVNAKGLKFAFASSIGKKLTIQNAPGGDTAKTCVPGAEFPVFEPTLSQFLMTYATGARSNNNYLNFITGWFKYQGYDVKPDTKISDIINLT